MPKMPIFYECKTCHFKCSKRSNFNEHLFTSKHQNRTKLNEKTAISCQTIYACKKCNKLYKARNSLWYHEKKCTQKDAISNTDISSSVYPDMESLTKLFMNNIKENQEFQKQIITAIKDTSVITNNTNNTHNNNTINNNKFNLNVFLNETCKDALNISDFVNSLQLQIQDLENTGEYGFTEGISRIFMRGLKELDIYKRPIHCSDLKRETIHVKSENKWEKEGSDRATLKKAIKQIANKNICMIPEWKKANPGCEKYDSRKNDKYLKLVVESMGPTDEKDEEKEFNKIIRFVAKETVIDKDCNLVL